MSEVEGYNAVARCLLEKWGLPSDTCPEAVARKAAGEIVHVLWLWDTNFACDLEGLPLDSEPIGRLRGLLEAYETILRRRRAGE